MPVCLLSCSQMYTITTVVLVAQSFYYEVINPKPEEQAEEEVEEAETLEVSVRCRIMQSRTVQCRTAWNDAVFSAHGSGYGRCSHEPEE